MHFITTLRALVKWVPDWCNYLSDIFIHARSCNLLRFILLYCIAIVTWLLCQIVVMSLSREEIYRLQDYPDKRPKTAELYHLAGKWKHTRSGQSSKLMPLNITIPMHWCGTQNDQHTSPYIYSNNMYNYYYLFRWGLIVVTPQIKVIHYKPCIVNKNPGLDKESKTLCMCL